MGIIAKKGTKKSLGLRSGVLSTGFHIMLTLMSPLAQVLMSSWRWVLLRM